MICNKNTVLYTHIYIFIYIYKIQYSLVSYVASRFVVFICKFDKKLRICITALRIKLNTIFHIVINN